MPCGITTIFTSRGLRLDAIVLRNLTEHLSEGTTMKHSSIRKFAFGAVLACLPVVAVAATLSPGGMIMVPGTTVAAQPVLGGTVINDDVQTQFIDIVSPFFAIGTDVQNRVVRSSTDGTLIFAPRILTVFNNTGANFLVDRMVLTGFGDFAVDAAYRTDGLGDRGPTNASRSADGNTMTFDYGFPLIGSNLAPNPQESSYFLSLNTAATAFTLEGRISIFARQLDHPGETYRFDFGNIAVPAVAAVPLPASWLLLASALGMVGLAKRRN